MRKVLILGATGLIGSTITRFLQKQHDFEVHAVSRDCSSIPLPNTHNCDMSYQSLNSLMQSTNPTYVVNCVGLTKHLASGTSNTYLFPNVLIPLYLKRLKLKYGYSLIHISSDCVFSGLNAPYSDTDQPDAQDHYGATKAISETLLEADAMILRTSTVGHEQNTKHGLLEWFLSQSGRVNGYKNAYFNGVTTFTLAKLIYQLICSNVGFRIGIFNVASERISKYDFLCIVQKLYRSDNNIVPDEKVNIDRSLIQSKHINENYCHSDWMTQLIQMKEEFND